MPDGGYDVVVIGAGRPNARGGDARRPRLEGSGTPQAFIWVTNLLVR